MKHGTSRSGPLISLVLLAGLVPALTASAATVTGEIIDAVTDQLLAARVYIQHADRRWFFPESASPNGSAVRYQKSNSLNTNAVEFHTTLSAHPFRVDLEPGVYLFTAERGKEYRPFEKRVEVGAEPMQLRLPLRRWVNMAQRGWFSGDTHVHRTLADLPNVMLAEDLNVAFPLTYWVTKAFAPPTAGDKNSDRDARAELIRLDATHVIYPRNTEYEIFTVNGKSHTLGAVFVLNHRTPLAHGAPPVGPIAGQTRREGALLDLDKHNWPWSMAIVPLMQVDLFELANNHLWRTEYAFTNWAVPAPGWMGIGSGIASEREWTLYGFQNYYALLNCGFRLRSTGGTANGVHPVPLGFGRVYVHLPRGFSYEAWVKGLNDGRSFVTTGPMLLAQADGKDPGHRFEFNSDRPHRVQVEATVLSEAPATSVEIIVNGDVAYRLLPRASRNRDGAFVAEFRQSIELTGSSWIAVRCWEERDRGRVRFAHTAPWFFEVRDAPLRARKEEAEFLARRVREQIERSIGVLPPDAIAEYRKALEAFENIGRNGR